MADDDRRLVREIADIVATTSEFRYRRATGEHIPWHEQVELQRRKILVLRALAELSPHDREVRDVLSVTERVLQPTTAPASGPQTDHRPDLGGAL